jgi:hypothetical protein
MLLLQRVEGILNVLLDICLGLNLMEQGVVGCLGSNPPFVPLGSNNGRKSTLFIAQKRKRKREALVGT